MKETDMYYCAQCQPQRCFEKTQTVCAPKNLCLNKSFLFISIQPISKIMCYLLKATLPKEL